MINMTAPPVEAVRDHQDEVDEPTVTVADTVAEQDETEALLTKAGLDHVPTIEEAKLLVEARRKEIRHAVLVEADRRSWCEDGTRKVCANLRLERPGNRVEKLVEVELNIKVVVPLATWTNEGALEHLKSKGLLSPTWLKNQLYVRAVEVTPLAASIEGTTLDVSTLTEKKPEVPA